MVGGVSSRRGALAAIAAAVASPLVGKGEWEWESGRRTMLQTLSGRPVPLYSWVPRGRSRSVVIFSHGAASAPWHYLPLIGPWLKAGYEVHAPLHPDSPHHPYHDRIKGLAGWTARLEDVQTVTRRLEPRTLVAAGHSYGALVALTMGGAVGRAPDSAEVHMGDPRTSCVVAFSPPAPIASLIDAAGYARLAKPALIQTGTRDNPPGSADNEAWRGHLASFEAGEGHGDRYALILDGVDHYFGGLICDPDKPGPPRTRALATAARVATRFMEEYSGNAPSKGASRWDRDLVTIGGLKLLRR